MKKLMYLIIFFISIFNYGHLIQSDELLELNCFNETQCRQFEHSAVKASCIEEQCQCRTSSGQSVKCRPLDSKVNNIIGGACPCTQANAECDKQQDVCYCLRDYMPSSDKRRCIPKIVVLGKSCEQDSQCQMNDFNAFCHESKECKCKDHFVNIEGKCVSILGNKSICSNDSQCIKQYGPNTEYNNMTQYCICKTGYIASVDNLRCLKMSKYFENCSENLQCIGTMGLGGKCKENTCQCSKNYFEEEKKHEDGTIETVCTAIIERGHYCRYHEDCYQRQLNEIEQSMDCVYGECNCKKGFYSYNDGNCIKGSGACNLTIIGFQLMTAILLLVNKYFA